MFPPTVRDAAATIIARLVRRGEFMVTVESCTGGLVAAALTAIPGSSEAVYGGLVTYADAAKTAFAGVPGDLIGRHGAVSNEVARAMALGGLDASGADLSIAITGIAGPGGGSAAKPVGLVHFACATRADITTEVRRFSDLGRDGIRMASVEAALVLILGVLDSAG